MPAGQKINVERERKKASPEAPLPAGKEDVYALIKHMASTITECNELMPEKGMPEAKFFGVQEVDGEKFPVVGEVNFDGDDRLKSVPVGRSFRLQVGVRNINFQE